MNYLIDRFNELALKSIEKEDYLYTKFLNISEISDFYKSIKKYLFAEPLVFGEEYDFERKLVRFGIKGRTGFPVRLLKIKEIKNKFFRELGHRDYLGSIMSLGIKRDNIGDIIIKENESYIFVHKDIKEYLISELREIAKVKIEIKEIQFKKELITDININLEKKTIVISSFRLDIIISKVFNIPRNKTKFFIEKDKVFINSMIENKIHRIIKENDRISVKGKGKIKIGKIKNYTRKEKIVLDIYFFGG